MNEQDLKFGSLGLAETYKSQPSNPVDFLAKWLLNYCHASVKEDKLKDEAKHSQAKRDEHSKHIKEAEAEKKQEIGKSETKTKTIEAFYQKFHDSDDLENHLQELSDFLRVSKRGSSL